MATLTYTYGNGKSEAETFDTDDAAMRLIYDIVSGMGEITGASDDAIDKAKELVKHSRDEGQQTSVPYDEQLRALHNLSLQ